MIYKALLKYGHPNFTLYILEYCSKADLLAREQYYLSSFSPYYNILTLAGNSLGYKHTTESIEIIRLAKVGKYDGLNNPFFGKTHSEDSLKLMSTAKKGKYTGVNNSFYGKTHSPETIAQILSKNPTMKSIYVYDSDNLTLIYQFKSIREAIKSLKTSQVVFYRSLDTEVKFRNKWVITSCPIKGSID